jgi:hypothetical protein
MVNDENAPNANAALTMAAARTLIIRYRRQRERAIGLADARYQLRMRQLWQSLIDHGSMRGHENQIMALLHEELEYIPVAEVAIHPPPPLLRTDGVQVQTNGRLPLGDITNTNRSQ